MFEKFNVIKKMVKITVLQGDITTQKVDAIVNAANRSLPHAISPISTGVYGYPKEKAVKIVHQTITDFLKNNQFFHEIRFITHSKENKELYEKYLMI